MSLASKLTQERRNRLAAERRLELKEAELSSANRKLGKHALELSEEIVETRAQVATIRGENQRVKSDLSAANQKIKIAERRLWHSIETINDGFAFFNSDNEMIMANRAYLAIFDDMEIICPGVNYATILQVLTDEGIVNTGDMSAADWRQMMNARYALPEPEPIVIQLWNDRFIKLVDHRGPEGDVVSLGLDISASVAYEDQLRHARAAAESANRAKSAFLANMSHEIRTPMNGVIGMADLLSEGDLNEDQRLYVDTIRNSGNALLVIINDVLDYSKINAKKLQLHPEAFDLERAIMEVLLLLHPSAEAKGLSLGLEYDLFLPGMLISDPGRIRQILTNLIGNALKFTTEGHVLVRVTGAQNEGADGYSLEITIEDTGIGIPADMVGHIFDEFNQVENERNRQFDGTGLGLAISQRLVEMIGGNIWVTSEEGVGSCFGVDLEMQISGSFDAETPSMPDELREVVIVDGALVDGAILARLMARLNIKAGRCADLDELRAGFGQSADLLMVTEGQVAEVIEYLQAESLAVPVVLLSIEGKKEREDLAGKYPGHIHGVLQSPFLRQDLFDVLAGIDFGRAAEVLRPMRVLAAEDNKTNQLVFRKMIQELNLDLTFASNGEEAVALYQQIAPDLIFMDISMPTVDGKEATAAIRAMETGQRIPIVALTAHAMDGDDKEILAAGLDQYLTKPLRKPLILEVIQGAHKEGMEPLYRSQADG